MNGADNRIWGSVKQTATPADRLLLDLDTEAQSLSPEVMDKLAAARHRAIMASQRHCQSHEDRARGIRHDRLPSAAEPRRTPVPACSGDRPTGRSVRHYLDSLLQSPVMTASLATCCVAALSALMVFNTPQRQDNPTEDLAMATPESGMATSPLPVETTTPFIMTTSSGSPSVYPVPLIATEESLDLVGSVDFLLWLDSQQG